MADNDTARPVTASARYEHLASLRDPFLRRARDGAALTIPTLMPPEGSTGTTDLPTPYQSEGADGVNNLTAKVMLALFPPGEPFVRLRVEPFVLDELVGNAVEGASEETLAQIHGALRKIESSLSSKMEKTAARKTLFECIMHLVVCGNGLLHVTDKGKLLFYALDKYVCKRDREGTILDIVVKESIARASADKKVLEIVAGKIEAGHPDANKDAPIDIYTWIYRKPSGKGWKVQQEVCGEIIPGTTGSYPEDKCPWLPLRWAQVSGEDYGRGRVEEYYGDLKSLEEAEKAILVFGAIASKVVGMVKEGSLTDPRELAEAEPGAIIEGDPEDVGFLQVEKAYDFQTVYSIAEDRRQRLKKAFLQGDAARRNAERVTAEEIRAILNELEVGLGGVYSQLAEELQRPLATIYMHQMAKAKELPNLPDDTITLQIVTGLDALGRNNDLQKLDTLLLGLSQIFGQEAIAKHVKPGEYLSRRSASLGIDTTNLIKTPEEIAQEEQAAMQAQAAQQAIGPGINALGKMATEEMRMGQQQTMETAQ